MAKSGPDLESIKQGFLTYILRGEDIESAKSRAGVNDDRLVIDWLAELRDKGTHEGAHEIEAAQAALSTLKELCTNAEAEETRCAAARALLQYVSGRQKNRTTEKVGDKSMTINLGESLWDFSR
jgi:hypothetical protein